MPFPSIRPALAEALEAQGYLEPTPVQAAVLSPDAADRDLLVSAQTGSGKTVAYGLALAPTLLGEADRLEEAAAPLALAIAPTRELALQVAEELTWLYARTGARIATCVGGMDPRREQRALAAGAHIVVGTPGRLRDHLERGNLDLSALRAVVLDEADEMLDMGFREDLEELLDATPAERRTLLFSATLAREIVALARRYQRDALRIDTIARDVPHGDIDYRAIAVAPNDLEHAVVNILRYFEAPSALVFCNTREGVRQLHGALRERGFAVVGLSGELSQKERSDALQALRSGQARVCVATDVAARGLDIPDLGLVVHADLPVNKAGLLHRSGRTGRAGRKGISVILASYTRRRRAEQLLASSGVDVTWSGPPSAAEIRAGDQARLMADPALSAPPTEDEAPIVRELLAGLSAEQVAAALVRLHRARLPAPEDLFDDRDAREAQAGREGRRERPQREHPERLAADDVVWFRATVGRKNNADPKWLVPLICRLGHVTKKDIGQIRIFDRETKFEIAKAVQARFASAVEATAGEDIRIEPAGAPGPQSPRPHAGKPPRQDRGPPKGGKPFSPKGGKPFAGKDRKPYPKKKGN